MGLGYTSLFDDSTVIVQELFTSQADTVRQPAAPSHSVHHHTALVGHRLFQGKPLLHQVSSPHFKLLRYCQSANYWDA